MSKYTEENPFNLTSKQLQFCEAYLFHEDCRFNAAASARMAGYSKKYSDRSGSETLRNIEVQKHLKFLEDKFKQELQKRTPADAAEILEQILQKKYGMDYSPVNIVAAMELWFKLHNKFPNQKLEVTGRDGEPIEVSETTRMVMIMPNERPVPEFPPGYNPETTQVKQEKVEQPPVKKSNAAKNIILQTLTKKGVKS